MAMTNALVGTARVNNFRLNYLAEAVDQQRRAKVGILLDGEDVRRRVRLGSVTIRDVINDAPNTAALAIAAAAHEAYAEGILSEGPIAYWRLGDVTATALDQTGRGHTGVVQGGITINVPGAIGDGDRAMHFSGAVGSRIDVDVAADLALVSTLAVEAWVKTDQASQQGGLVEKTINFDVDTSYALMQNGPSWLFEVAIVGVGVLSLTIPVAPSDVGQWVHLVGTYHTAGHMAFYKQGTLQAYRDDAAGTVQAGAGPLIIGHRGIYAGTLIWPFAGAIDEVAVYPYLYAERVARHYANAFGEAPPTVAQSLRITVGVDAPVLLFNGAVNQVAVTYEGRPEQAIYHCSATDDTARANRRRPFGEWTNVSATTVAQQLIAQFAPGLGTAFVQAGLPPVTVIFDGSEGMNRCLTQITNLIGGYWYFLDSQLHLFLTETTDPPDPIDMTPQRFLDDPPIAGSTEMSQVRTRVYGRGHGEQLLSAVLAGETILPIADTTMFAPTGGKAIALSQVLAYTGRDLGGNGSLVGPGAGPSVALTPTLAAGAGLGNGVYQYAYTNVTSSGESLPGPIAGVTTGPLPAPSAPTVGLPTIGTGPDPGTHQYATTFVTSGGETTPGPTTAVITGLTPGPTVPPIPGAAAGAGLDLGHHDYVVTFVTAIGETTPSPSGPVDVYQIANPTAAPTVVPISTGNYWPGVAAYTFVFATQWSGANSAIHTALGPTTSRTLNPGDPWVQQASGTVPLDPHIRYATVYYSSDGGALWLNFGGPLAVTPGGGFAMQGFVGIGTGSPAPTNVPAAWVNVQNIPLGDATVSARHLFRRFNGTGPFQSLDTIPNNTATTYTDTAPNARLGAAAPSVNTASLQRFPLTVPVGGALVTSRKIYRTAAGGATLKLATTIADNVTTSWIDTIPDASLGAAAPGSNTATANQVALSGIAIGASSVTARKVYRTAVNGAQLKLLTTLANNSTLTYLDALGDGSLGANAPTGDTSLLTQPQGQVNAGSSTLPTASAGPFRPSGWVIIGAQLVRYTGISGNTLTGIPPSGIGALITTVRYGDHVLAAPVLTGVTVAGGLTAPEGTTIYLWVQRDDVPAQTAMAARDGGDGIYEYLVQDERRGEPSITALCDAHLIAYKDPIATVAYATRDLKTKSGKPIRVDLVSPPIRGTLVIQDVTIDEIDIAPGLAPRFTVTASSVRLSLDDLLRQLAGTLEAS